jgi:hypothetical protein
MKFSIFFAVAFLFSASLFGQLHIAQGVTTPSDWRTYTPNVDLDVTLDDGTELTLGGIYVDVNTSNCNFAETPHYIVSIESGSPGRHWLLSGASSIYNATPNGFRVYLTWTDYLGHPTLDNPVSVSVAQDSGWFIRWTAISSKDCDCK